MFCKYVSTKTMRLSTREMHPNRWVSYTYDIEQEKKYQTNRRMNDLLRGESCGCERCNPNTTGVINNGTI